MREFAMLKQVFQRNVALPDHVTLPPGDDMGAIHVTDGDLLVTVDQVIDGVHIHLDRFGIEATGRKAVLRNLSDVAAMAARPLGGVVACALPKAMSEATAMRLFNSMAEMAEDYDCPLFGGDISVHDGPLVISMTVLAEPGGIDPVRRNGAKPGNLIYVTGQLGGAWDEQGGGPHLSAQPRIEIARMLAREPSIRPTAMIDLSDGLAGDLRRICEQSDVAARIQLDALPLRPEAATRADQSGNPAWQHGLTDGEDYELCFTIDSENAEYLPDHIAGVAITQVGEIIVKNDQPEIQWLLNGQPVRFADSGWEHHA